MYKVSLCLLLLATVLSLTSTSPIKPVRNARGLFKSDTKVNLTTKFQCLINNLNKIQVIASSLHKYR